MKRRRSLALALLAPLIFMAAKCNLAQIVQVINAAVLIAEQAAAITGKIPPEYIAYVSAASQCLATAATEQASSHSPSDKALNTTRACAQYASIALPPGTAQNALDKAQQLAQAIQNILNTLSAAGPQGVAIAPGQTPPVASAPSLKPDDIRALKELSERATAVHDKLRR